MEKVVPHARTWIETFCPKWIAKPSYVVNQNPKNRRMRISLQDLLSWKELCNKRFEIPYIFVLMSMALNLLLF